ncbi:hypothetical protein Salmuc_01666 [Salipiger mucosus DSM 16094]|uniref:RNA 2'-phosphotransferase n=2 Tax=Salipiger mucosus TaxID=263378 RepID=S9QR48_9RHOB|nr:hypothetical protein Salmuc_01666 [Salipiger mucosus DSM 16094]
MAQDGHVFYKADNGVWLTESVPVGYLEVHGFEHDFPAFDDLE